MSKFIKINSETTTDLLTTADFSVYSTTNKRGSVNAKISKVIVANTSANTATVSLLVYQLASPNNVYSIIRSLKIPTGVTWVMDNAISFNISTHQLKLTNTGTGPALTVIID